MPPVASAPSKLHCCAACGGCCCHFSSFASADARSGKTLALTHVRSPVVICGWRRNCSRCRHCTRLYSASSSLPRLTRWWRWGWLVFYYYVVAVSREKRESRRHSCSRQHLCGFQSRSVLHERRRQHSRQPSLCLQQKQNSGTSYSGSPCRFQRQKEHAPESDPPIHQYCRVQILR